MRLFKSSTGAASYIRLHRLKIFGEFGCIPANDRMFDDLVTTPNPILQLNRMQAEMTKMTEDISSRSSNADLTNPVRTIKSLGVNDLPPYNGWQHRKPFFMIRGTMKWLILYVCQGSEGTNG